MSIAINDFVLRQVKGSGKTYSPTLSFEQIVEHAEYRMNNGKFKEGYRDGVRIIQATKKIASHFLCPFVRVSEDLKLEAKVIKRRDNEDSYIQIRALSGKSEIASRVNFICYRHDVLAENKENSTNEEWELVSMNAIPDGVKEMPMGPITMMRNQLELKGGTKGSYDSGTWARSVQFWQKYVPLKDF